MQSLKYLFRIGRGPSSSHTMGPLAAAERFLAAHQDAQRYEGILYGSLAKTGKGHMTDRVLSEVFAGRQFVLRSDCETPTDVHPNTMDLIAYYDGMNPVRQRFYSIGGGEIVAEGEQRAEHENVYSMRSFTTISE